MQQKLPSVVLIIGFVILFGAALVGWVIVPRVISSKITDVSCDPIFGF